MKFEDRILAFLQNIASGLAQNKIFVETPRRMWDGLATEYEWWLLVYPFARVDRPPFNALIVMMKLLEEVGTGQVMFALELGKVDGSSVDDLEVDVFVDRNDLNALDRQIVDFEDPNMIREVVKRVQAYIGKVRRIHPQGPREWSPRVKGAEMGAAKKKYDPIVVNLVEQEGWKPYTYDSSKFDERIMRLSDEEYSGLMNGEESQCGRLMEDIMGEFYSSKAPESPRDWSPRNLHIGPVGIKKACIGWKEGNLDEVDALIRDTIQYMYEETLIPDDNDIRQAMYEARDDFEKKFDLSPWIWEPLIEGNTTERSILMHLMNDIDYSRAQGKYDRFLIFDWMNSSQVADLLGKWPAAERPKIIRALRDEFEALRDALVHETFKEIAKTMDDSDISNRTDWAKHWHHNLADKKRMESVRKQVREYVKTAPALPEDEE